MYTLLYTLGIPWWVYASLLYTPGYTTHPHRQRCTPGYTVTASRGAGEGSPGLNPGNNMVDEAHRALPSP